MKNLKKNILWLVAFFVGMGMFAESAHGQYVGPENGQKVAFLGDSITFFGAYPDGWVTMVVKALADNGKKIDVIMSAYPGNTSRDMLARVSPKDLLGKKPDWVLLSCGVNDVWHPAPRAVPLEEYKKNITSIVDQATAAGAKVVILTPTLIGENPTDGGNKMLDTYIDFLRTLATEKHLLLIDLNADMKAALAEAKAKYPNVTGALLTKDGVHPNGPGNVMMATGVLKGFGFTDEQLAKLKETWLDQPGGYPLTIKQPLTINQYLQLRDIAAEKGQTVDEMLAEDIGKDGQSHLSVPAQP